MTLYKCFCANIYKLNEAIKKNMLNKKTFEELRKQMEQYDKLREQVIANSRHTLKTSKAAIYAAHRKDMIEAGKLLKSAQQNIKKTEQIIKKDFHLGTTGAYSEALEEYTEAACYIYYLNKKEIPSPDEIGVDADTYLPALSDVVGELVRKAINSTIQGDYKTALEIKDTVTDLYAELMLFDWRNTLARKKFDSIKYGLEKLEDLALKIRMKN